MRRVNSKGNLGIRPLSGGGIVYKQRDNKWFLQIISLHLCRHLTENDIENAKDIKSRKKFHTLRGGIK